MSETCRHAAVPGQGTHMLGAVYHRNDLGVPKLEVGAAVRTAEQAQATAQFAHLAGSSAIDAQARQRHELGARLPEGAQYVLLEMVTGASLSAEHSCAAAAACGSTGVRHHPTPPADIAPFQ